MYLNQYYHFSPNHTHNTCSSCLASSFLLPSSIPSSSFLIHLPIPLTLLWQLSRQHQRCLGKDMKGHAPVQAECQEGNVQDGCQREAEVADDLTNCLCLCPVRVRLAKFCIYMQLGVKISARHRYFPVTRVNQVGYCREEAEDPNSPK